jgi:predicted acetyltransferase
VNIQVTPVVPEDRARLAALFELYAYDFSEILGFDVGDDGRFGYPYLDAYFSEPRRHAFLFRVDGKLAGFALVQRRSQLSGDERVHDMSEFFVMRHYRRHGVGDHAAVWLFDHFRGPWEVREKPENHGATVFWRRIIARYTGGAFEDLVLDEERWHGPVQRFDSSVR